MLKANTLKKFRRTNLIISRFNNIDNVREIKLHPLGCKSCFATSDFSEHIRIHRILNAIKFFKFEVLKNPTNKPHTLVCGKLKGFFDVTDLELNLVEEIISHSA